MKTTKLFAVAIISVGLSLGMTAQAKEKKHEEQTINSSDVPAAVQTAGENEAKGGKILRWEKEGDNFEAVVEKHGKEWASGSTQTARCSVSTTRRPKRARNTSWLMHGPGAVTPRSRSSTGCADGMAGKAPDLEIHMPGCEIAIRCSARCRSFLLAC